MSNKAKIAGLGVIVAVLIAVMAWAVFGMNRPEPATADPDTPTVTETAPAPSDGGGAGVTRYDDEEELGGPDVGLAEGTGDDRVDSANVATAAANAWVNHDVDRAAWTEALKPLVREQAWPSFDLPDPKRVGPTAVTGEANPVDVSEETAEILVPTDAGDLAITLIKESDQWLVTDIDKTLPPAAGSGAEELRPMIGEGDPMLGLTEGTERPEDLSQLDTDQLEPTNAREQAEAFRRHIQDANLGGDQWRQAVESTTDGTFGMVLPHVDRTIFDDVRTAGVEVVEEYDLDNPGEPFALVAGLDEEGEPVWTATMQFEESKADPSIVTWQVASIRWEHPSLLDGRMGPLTSSERTALRNGAAAAALPLFVQELGANEDTLREDLSRTMAEPDKAVEAGLPFPETNTRVHTGEMAHTLPVTPRGSDAMWIQVTNRSFEVTVTGERLDDAEEVQRTVFVRIERWDGHWVAVDAQVEDPRG